MGCTELEHTAPSLKEWHIPLELDVEEGGVQEVVGVTPQDRLRFQPSPCYVEASLEDRL